MFKEIQFQIRGMTCAACSSGIERALMRKDGIKKAAVNLVSQSASVSFDPNLLDEEKIFEWILKLGYEPYFQETKEEQQGGRGWLDAMKAWIEWSDLALYPWLRVGLALILSFVVVFISMTGMFDPALLALDAKMSGVLQLILTLVVMHLGRRFFIHGFKALLAGMPNMDTLIALGSSVSFAYSLYGLFFHASGAHLYFESVCVIIAFVLLGKNLEDHVKNKSTQEINALETFYQSRVYKQIDDEKYQEVAIKEIKENDVIKVLPGGVIPVDGVIVKGLGSIDESMLSGESLPVRKMSGDEVYAGSWNGDQMLIIQAKRDSTLSTMAQIFQLTQAAQATKAPIARLADRVSGVFVPAVMIFGLVAGVIWWRLDSLSFGVNVFVSVLVVSCPCALGLATPMAILIGSIKGLKNGILFKNARALEETHKVNRILFDKTGTLTQGALEVCSVMSLDGRMGEDEIIKIAKSLESNSHHLIAQAILRYAPYQESLKVCNWRNEMGLGVSGVIDGVEYKIGSSQYFDQEDFKALSADLENQEKMRVFLARKQDGKYQALGVIFLQDQIKKEAKECIAILHQWGIQTQILSGDRDSAVAHVAGSVGIHCYEANLKPQDKLERIQQLKNKKEKVMMVGDGLNDAPSLALADIAVAMGAGSDLSKEKADVILLNGSLFALLNAIALSKKVMQNIKMNLFWAFFYNIIAIALAAGLGVRLGIAFNPMLAAVAMSLSSLCVVLNAQRLYGFKFLRSENEN